MKKSHSNRDYENTHGKSPKGRGSWAFKVSVYATNRGWTDLGIHFASSNLTLAQARKETQDWAAQEARATIGGATEVQTETLG